MDAKTTSPLTFVPPRGRGSVANVAHRFEAETRVGFDDGWGPDTASSTLDEAEPPRLPTVTVTERARRIISHNDSPDIPFDRAINPYRGCEHGCTYCYARVNHAYLGYSPGLDFETRLIAKENAVEVLRQELGRRGYRPAVISIGSATDGYQPIEREWRLTRRILELMDATSHPVTIITKNALVERDIDILARLASRKLASVFMSITTLDATMARQIEPRASAPWRRVACLKKLSDAGIPTGVMVAPLIPFITDSTLEQVLVAAGEAGASQAGYTVIRLPHEVREVFEAWLQAHFPDRASRVLHRIRELNGSGQESFHTRMRGSGIWAQLLAQRFAVAARKAGLQLRSRPELDTTRFVPPSPDGQQSLF